MFVMFLFSHGTLFMLKINVVEIFFLATCFFPPGG